MVLVLINTTAKAQIVMSSIGMMGTASGTISALNFKSTASCIDIQSGVAILNGVRGNGAFAFSCEVAMNFNRLGIKLYPNPVTSNTKVKFINTPPLTEQFSLQIFTAEGQFISSKKETGYNLFQGITLDLSNITSGSYILKITSTQFVDAIKFIKAN
ncbi:MAG: T9SS type A sorting domain-containing protein [Bacteroidetes bacterium]|nr:T9SS type A sorting domain-containing protein [Bacteroidota bacterium]